MRWRQIGSALAIGAAACFLLCGYEFVRSVSASLYIGVYGAERLPVVMTLAPIGTLLMIYGYGCLLSWTGAKGALLLTSLLSALGIVGCYAAIVAGMGPATGVLYVLREAYIVLLVEQYWSFIDSTLGSGEARRLNGPVCGIASLGAVSGGLLVGKLAHVVQSERLLLFAALSLVPAGLLSVLAYHLGGEPKPEETAAHRGHLPLGLFRKERMLICLALLIATTQIVSTMLDLRFNMSVADAYPVKDDRTAYMGGFYGMLNGVAAVLQFIVSPLLLAYVPLRLVHFGIPLIHLAAAAALVVHPGLGTSALAYLLFKDLDYSVFRAGKEMLYIPLSFDARYRAKEVIDAFLYRFAKGAASGILQAAKALFGRLPLVTYPIVVIASALFWLGLVDRLTRPTSDG